jgi:uncharacterized protein (TIGR04141 family)
MLDNVAEIRDPSEIKRLNALLESQLADVNHEVCLAPPDVVDWQNVHAFIVEHENGPAPSVNLSFTDIRRMLQPDQPTCSAMKSIKVRTENPAGIPSQQAWSLFDCLVTEIDDPGNVHSRYILMAGMWYVVAKSLVDQVNLDLTQIRQHGHQLPNALPAETEAEYNIRLAQSDSVNLFLLDKKTISYGGGHSRIEVCDVLSNSSCHYHIKDYHGSATLSHLFA